MWLHELEFSYVKIAGTYKILIPRMFAALCQILGKKDLALGKEHWTGTITPESKLQLSLTRSEMFNRLSSLSGLVME